MSRFRGRSGGLLQRQQDGPPSGGAQGERRGLAREMNPGAEQGAAGVLEVNVGFALWLSQFAQNR